MTHNLNQSLSKKIASNQGELSHLRLKETIEKHLSNSFQRPVSQTGLDAFSEVKEIIDRSKDRLILDSGCGTGMSSIHLAEVNPSSFVIGIDKSSVRLKKRGETHPENLYFVRINLTDFWTLFKNESYLAKKQFLLYPNPWPKAEHLKRRWHGHPIFPLCLAAAEEHELRTNWEVYADEFAATLFFSGWRAVKESIVDEEPISLHEKKYMESGHQLWKVIGIRK